MKIEERDGQTIVADEKGIYYLYLVAFTDRQDNPRLVFSQNHSPETLTIPGRVIYSRALLPNNKRIIKNHGGPTVIPNRQ